MLEKNGSQEKTNSCVIRSCKIIVCTLYDHCQLNMVFEDSDNTNITSKKYSNQKYYFKNFYPKKIAFTKSVVINYLPKYMQVYFWTFNSVPQVLVSVFLPIPHCSDYHRFVVNFEVRECDTQDFILSSQDCFGYSGSFVVPYKSDDFLLYFFKNFHWHYDRTCTESVYCFRTYC